ncbi:MAG TPA: hypothetical protein PLP42_17330, partial [Acidobacteriota bacterium]|nr:hypothetical protein [Acidobacteriota bacterium]
MNHVSRLCFTATLFFAICASTLEIHAQQVIDFDERLPKDRPEFWAMKLVGSELLMTAMGPPDAIEPGQIELGIEAGWLPSLNQEQRMIGFSGTKEEHVNRTPVFARPRASFGLPHDIRVAVGYVPPFRIDGIRPNVLTLSAGRPVFSTTFWRIGVRAHGLLGNLSGDITCDRDTVAAGEDLVRNPYRCE